MLKFIYSEKATKSLEISTLLLFYVVPVKSKGEISQNFVAFSEYMNFNSRTTDTQRLNPYFFAAQIEIPTPKRYLGFEYTERLSLIL